MNIQKIPFRTFRRTPQTQTVVPKPSPRFSLARTFVQTGDERCPIAGIWSRLIDTDADTDTDTDDPEIFRPVMGSLLPMTGIFTRASHSFLTVGPL